MSKSSLLLSGLILLSLVAVAQKKVTKPVHVIFDTDMGPDYDGAGAITMLHAYADRGEAEILATITSTKYEGVAAVLKVFNTYSRNPIYLLAFPGKGRRTTRLSTLDRHPDRQISP